MIVVIPSIGKSPYLPVLLESLLADDAITDIWVVDNSPGGWPSRDLVRMMPMAESARAEAEVGDRLHFILDRDAGIYETWNRGIRFGTVRNVPCAILNDDIQIEPGALSTAARYLSDEVMLVGLNHSRPADHGAVVVYGTYRTLGFGGFAFIVGPGCPQVDPRFRWWYGDDDLGYRIMESGHRMVVALDAPVRHPHPSLSGGADWIPEAIASDVALMDELWPGRR